jgi:hypothetical protein
LWGNDSIKNGKHQWPIHPQFANKMQASSSFTSPAQDIVAILCHMTQVGCGRNVLKIRETIVALHF